MLQKKFSFNWIRIFFLYGDEQPSKSIYGQLVKAVENKSKLFDMSLGLQQRDYLPVEEVAKIISLIALKRESLGVINCCSGKPIKLVDFVKQRLCDFRWSMQLNLGKYDYPKYEAFEFWGSTKKLNEILRN
jgi:dTDP-6-deoxy-L-talose 4-dehydrogenase (NAD+)